MGLRGRQWGVRTSYALQVKGKIYDHICRATADEANERACREKKRLPVLERLADDPASGKVVNGAAPVSLLYTFRLRAPSVGMAVSTLSVEMEKREY